MVSHESAKAVKCEYRYLLSRCLFCGRRFPTRGIPYRMGGRWFSISSSTTVCSENDCSPACFDKFVDDSGEPGKPGIGDEEGMLGALTKPTSVNSKRYRVPHV
jgi:hypothetical protein